MNWVKKINFNKTIEFFDYKYSKDFIKVADIVLDNNSIKRKTLIRFDNIVNNKIFKEKTEWIYMITIDKRIVKIGGTRDGLYNRTRSYLCGHHTTCRGGSGKCSVTNAYIYNTMYHYLKQEHNIEMYAFKIPEHQIKVQIFNENFSMKAQSFHLYESLFLENFKNDYKILPQLSNNYLKI